MLRTRVMPALLLLDKGLVKTEKFKNGQYIGDPINTARIFNEMEVDELVLLDVGATVNRHLVQFELVEIIVSECFMPICYGGGVRTISDFERLFHSGVEKVSAPCSSSRRASSRRSLLATAPRASSRRST